MDNSFSPNIKLSVIRGATTSKGNTKEDIRTAVHELIDELISRNNLESNNILSIILIKVYKAIVIYLNYQFQIKYSLRIFQEIYPQV